MLCAELCASRVYVMRVSAEADVGSSQRCDVRKDCRRHHDGKGVLEVSDLVGSIGVLDAEMRRHLKVELTNHRVNIVIDTSIIELDRRLNLRCSKGAREVFQRCSKAFVSFRVLKVQCLLEETLDASGSWCIDPNQYAHLWGLGRRQDRSSEWQLGRNCICQHELHSRISVNDA